jgi:site-specific DNA recombinase
LPYIREEDLAEKLGQILKNIQIPDSVLTQLEKSLLTDNGRLEQLQSQQRERLEHRLAMIAKRFDQAYTDKLDGKIPEEFWARKAAEWQSEKDQIEHAVRGLGLFKPERVLDAVKILELANKAYSLYVTQSAEEKAKLLRLVLSNCSIDAVSLYPTYRKPFDLIFERTKNEEWRGREDLNLQGLAPGRS